MAWHRRRKEEGSDSRQERRERERGRESSVPPFGFPAPLVALLAGKDDDEDTKEGLEALTVMEIQTRTRRRGCGAVTTRDLALCAWLWHPIRLPFSELNALLLIWKILCSILSWSKRLARF